LWPLDDVELDLLALCQRAEALGLNRRVMDEYVRAAVLNDEAESLCVVEPLHFATCHVAFLLLCSYARTCAPARAAPCRRSLGRLESSLGICCECDTTNNRFPTSYIAPDGPDVQSFQEGGAADATNGIRRKSC